MIRPISPRWGVLVLALGVTFATPSPQAAAEAVLYLHTEFLPYSNEGENPLSQRLTRELFRQALLIAARHELGITCYDETLDEAVPAGENVTRLMLSERGSLEGKWTVKLYHSGDADWRTTEPIWQREYETSRDESELYAQLVPMLETASRTELVEALKLAGFASQEPPPPPPQRVRQSAKKKPSLDELVAKVDFIAQFGAAYRLHTDIATDDETPERVQKLARVYAQLSALTQHTWNSSSDVFAARALLYAQRSAGATDSSPDALWTRAYASALTGSLQHAEADLRRLMVDVDAPPPAPAETSEPPEAKAPVEEPTENDQAEAEPPREFHWRELLVPYVRCDRQWLDTLAKTDPGLTPWATQLDFQLALAHRYPRAMYDALYKVLEAAPTGYPIASNVALKALDPSVAHTAADSAAQYFAYYLFPSLSELDDLPPEIARQLPLDAIGYGMLGFLVRDPNPHDLFSPFPNHFIRLLRKAGPDEPSHGLSWEVLGYLIEEEQFVLAAGWCHAKCRTGYESAPKEHVEGILPFVKDHRYGGLIESYLYNPATQLEEYKLAVERVTIRDPRANMATGLYQLRRHLPGDAGTSPPALEPAPTSDFTLHGIIESTYPFNHTSRLVEGEPLRTAGERLTKVAPHLEVGTRMLLQATVEPTLEQLAEWQAKVKQDADCWKLLGERYEKQDKLDEALHCFTQSRDVLMVAETAINLAEFHERQGNHPQWEEVLKAFLLKDAYDVDLALVHNALAKGYMRRGDWSKAKTPHATTAAESYAGWGLLTASRACEGLAHWQESEEWIQQVSQYYPSSSAYEWFFWCCRTGRGDLDSAEEYARHFFAARPPHMNRAYAMQRGVFHVLIDELEQAREDFEYVSSASPQPSATCLLMRLQLNRELGDDSNNDELLEQLRQTMAERLTSNSDRADVWHATLAIADLIEAGEATPEQLAHLDQKLAAIEGNLNKGTFCYLAGVELDYLDLPEESERYWRIALNLPAEYSSFATLAGQKLAYRYGTSRPDEPLTEEDLWPPREEF